MQIRKNIYDFFCFRDSDSRYLLSSIEGLCSNLVAILFWMYVNSEYMDLTFVTSAAVASIAATTVFQWKEKFKVMLFIVTSIALIQFGLYVFLQSKILILIFVFIYIYIIFSFPKYRIYAGMSVFPAVTIVWTEYFNFEATVNRCFYQIIAFLIAFFLAVLFSFLTSKFKIRKILISYTYFLKQRVENIISGENLTFESYMHQNHIFQKMGFNMITLVYRSEYLLQGHIDYCKNAKKLVTPLFAVPKGLLLLQNPDRKNETINSMLNYIDDSLQKLLNALKKHGEIKLDDYPGKPSTSELKGKSPAYRKNIYVLENIITDLQSLNGYKLDE